MILFIILLVPLIGLALFSLRLAFSGGPRDRPLTGWIVFLLSIFLTREVIGGFINSYPDPSVRITVGIVGVILFGCQAPLIIALVTELFTPRGSASLKLLETHSKAERLAVEDDLPGAVNEYKRIVAENPADIEAISRLADLLYEDGEFRESAKVYEDLLRRSDDLGMARHCSVLTKLVELHANNFGDMEKARSFAEAIIKKYPNSRYAGFARSRISNM
jgi:tetratricopeptide (TPR) repeat protein